MLKSHLLWNINKRLLFYLVIGFLISVIAGTLSHEFGHYCIAELLGYKAEITYGYTFWESANDSSGVDPLHGFYITLGGPVQTMLTGTLGLILLFVFNNSFLFSDRPGFWQWTLIFLSLFWLRQTANFLIWIAGYLLNGQFSKRSDEIKISNHLEIPDWIIPFFSGMAGICVLATVIVKFIPIKHRITFMTAGSIGGSLGYLLWFRWIGRILLP